MKFLKSKVRTSVMQRYISNNKKKYESIAEYVLLGAKRTSTVDTLSFERN